jgi:hypothetical protein
LELARAFDPRMGCRPTVPEQHPKGDAMKRTPSSTQTPKPPTRKQLHYLRSLALQTGTSFTPPRSRDEASDEIDRLLRLTRASRSDRTRELRDVQRDLAERPEDATRIRRDETTGYGSTARWAHTDTEAQR